MRPLLSSEGWRRRAALWGGAIAVALVAIVFAKASDAAFHLFQRITAHSIWWALLLTPGIFALLAWLTSGALRPTRGSGIPQVIAALEHPDPAFRDSNLSLRVSVGKLALTTLLLLGGASVGREGPTVHVGASLMHVFGRWFGFRGPRELSHFLLAGGAAGIAAAFNTPLAGVVFAIEELSGRFEHRFSGTLLTAVIVGGVVSLGLLGSYPISARWRWPCPWARPGWRSPCAAAWPGYSVASSRGWCWPASAANRAGWVRCANGIRCCWPRCAALPWSGWRWCSGKARSVPATTRRAAWCRGMRWSATSSA
nr:membrane hypothetical protein [Xanthomonas citri pv. citri]